jgi:hypothetical protein
VHSPSALLRAALLLMAGALSSLSWGQAQVSEQELKAALVFNFARYIEWPDRVFASRESPMVLCVIGHDRFGTSFTALEGRKLQGRSVKVRSGIAIEDSHACQVVFIAEASERQLQQILHSLAGQPVLTVSDIEGFIDSGGAIGIVPGEQRLQFEVNRDTLDRAQLKASAQLLKLARAVLGKAN